MNHRTQYEQPLNRHTRRRENATAKKQQHFIPRSYLDAWLDPAHGDLEQPFVWMFDRDGPTDASPGRRKSPGNIFKESEMYTITSAQDPKERDLAIEDGLSQIEGDFCSIRQNFINPMRHLGKRERERLLRFAVAIQFRTPTFREHIRSQWQPVLDLGRRMEEQMKNAPPDAWQRLSHLSANTVTKATSSLTMDQVQTIVEKPLQSVLPAYIDATLPLLARATYLTIFCTKDIPGFITSDNPAVSWDPEGYKRPPLHQGPALMYDTFEMTMPISPSRLLFLSRKDMALPQYVELDSRDYNQTILNDINRRTCGHAAQKIIVSRNEFRPIWAEPGQVPSKC